MGSVIECRIYCARFNMIKASKTIKHPKFLLLYPPLQFDRGEQAKPDGSLGLIYIASALRNEGYEVNVFDAAVGNDKDILEESFFRREVLDSGLFRIGVSNSRILEEVSYCDIIGIPSIFTPQTSQVINIINLIKINFPEKTVITGGVNARTLRYSFFKAGVDFIFLSEAEKSIVEFAEWVCGSRNLSDVSGISYLDDSGAEIIQKKISIVTDLDNLPMPAWDLLPLQKYWDISRPHGGYFPPSKVIKYAQMQTSRGCHYSCDYCHISKESNSDICGEISKWRASSIDRVKQELNILKSLGVEYVFFEDDSLLAKKYRAISLFREIKNIGLKLANVNGLNIIHFFKKENGSTVVDYELLESMSEAGFNLICLPFESGSQRILDKYSSSKWSIEKTDTISLIKACNKLNITVTGNYMLGYPDETLEEIYETILFAKQHIIEGIDHALFFSVVPFPGSVLYDNAIKDGYLCNEFNTDNMKWTKAVLKNTIVPASTIDAIRQLAWLTVNRYEFVHYKLNQCVL